MGVKPDLGLNWPNAIDVMGYEGTNDIHIEHRFTGFHVSNSKFRGVLFVLSFV